MEGTIKRSSDGVPEYAGEPELLPAYKEEALQYLMTIEVKKRYLAGPRLAKELSGVAKIAITTQTNQDPQWLAHPRGTHVLLEFLENCLAKPTLVEASRYVMKFFYNMKRRRGETMTAWAARHAEALWEASQALRKVQKEFGSNKKTNPQRSWWSGRGNRRLSASAAPSEIGSQRLGQDDEKAEDAEAQAEGSAEGEHPLTAWNTEWPNQESWNDWA